MENKRSVVLLIFLLIAVIFVAGYYYLILPKKEEVVMKETSVLNLQAEISNLDQQNSLLEDEALEEQESLYTLRKKVPESRAIDQLLLSIQEIEFVTNSKVDNIAFNNYDGLVAESGLIVPEDETIDETVTEETTEQGETTTETTETVTEEPPVSPIASEAMPPNLKLITVSLDIRSEDYESLKEFLKELEALERVTRIDSIDFGLPGESKEFEEDASDVTSASVQITTFFYDGQ